MYVKPTPHIKGVFDVRHRHLTLRHGRQNRDLDRRIVRFQDLVTPFRAREWPESETSRNGLDRTWTRW